MCVKTGGVRATKLFCPPATKILQEICTPTRTRGEYVTIIAKMMAVLQVYNDKFSSEKFRHLIFLLIVIFSGYPYLGRGSILF